MREIKFRAWYKGSEYPMDKDDLSDFEKPTMIYNVQKLYDGRGVDDNPILGGYSCFGNLINNDDFVLMQYIKDENGVEVYEGDIINIADYNYCIEFKEGSFGIQNGDDFIVLSDLQLNGWWVNPIGNIYQNPELMEAR